jgi:prepilin-type N-terminal cleavage/methylation domain-containing protein
MPLRRRLSRGLYLPADRATGTRAFTIVEVMAALLIVAILAVLLVPNYSYFLAKAEEVVCVSRMRNVHAGLTLYLEDRKFIWPQGPRPEERGWAEFWVSTLEPFGVPRKHWECPTIRKMARQQGEKEFTLHYVPTLFPDTPRIAYRWATQPWLIEIADAHGRGPLICFPDGAIKPFSKVLAEQGVR